MSAFFQRNEGSLLKVRWGPVFSRGFANGPACCYGLSSQGVDHSLSREKPPPRGLPTSYPWRPPVPHLSIPISLVHPITNESGFPKTLTERDRAVYSDQVVQFFLQVGWFLKLQKNRAATSLLAAFSAQTSRACEGWTLTHDRMALVFKVCKPCIYLNERKKKGGGDKPKSGTPPPPPSGSASLSN